MKLLALAALSGIAALVSAYKFYLLTQSDWTVGDLLSGLAPPVIFAVICIIALVKEEADRLLRAESRRIAEERSKLQRVVNQQPHGRTHDDGTL